MPNLEEKIAKIEERNKKVELDKAWEVSWARRIVILVLTYIVITLFFLTAHLPEPFMSPIIPTVGFALSTLSLPYFKKIWIKYKK